MSLIFRCLCQFFVAHCNDNLFKTLIVSRMNVFVFYFQWIIFNYPIFNFKLLYKLTCAERCCQVKQRYNKNIYVNLKMAWRIFLLFAFFHFSLSFTFSPTAVMVTEFTHKGVRDRVLMVYSSFMSLSLVLCALVAWGLLPRPWDFIISEGYFGKHVILKNKKKEKKMTYF